MYVLSAGSHQRLQLAAPPPPAQQPAAVDVQPQVVKRPVSLLMLRYVLVAYATFANKHGRVGVGTPRLAAELDLSRAQIELARQELVRQGVLRYLGLQQYNGTRVHTHELVLPGLWDVCADIGLAAPTESQQAHDASDWARGSDKKDLKQERARAAAQRRNGISTLGELVGYELFGAPTPENTREPWNADKRNANADSNRHASDPS